MLLPGCSSIIPLNALVAFVETHKLKKTVFLTPLAFLMTMGVLPGREL